MICTRARYGYIDNLKRTYKTDENSIFGSRLEAEYYESPIWKMKCPKIQIITVEELLTGKKPVLPQTRFTNLELSRFKS